MLLNLFLADFPLILASINSHAPKLGWTHWSNLLYEDNLVLLSRTRVGMKPQMNATEVYTDANVMRINFKKILKFWSSPQRPWGGEGQLGTRGEQGWRNYKYLGLILDGSFRIHKEEIKKKGLALTAGLETISRHLNEPSHCSILEITRAKVVVSLVCGSEALRGRAIPALDKAVTQKYRQIFLPSRSTLPAQIRLEFGLTKQSYSRRASFVTFCYKLKTFEVNSINRYAWEEIIKKLHLPAYTHLNDTIDLLSLGELWLTTVSQDQLKKLHLNFQKSAHHSKTRLP